MIFYLGASEPPWLSRAGVPLFMSYHRMWRSEQKRKSAFQPALAQWALDSGGFTELNENGRWTITPSRYVKSVRRYVDEIGKLDWAAPQDWMCEDVVLRKTGLSVEIHQRRTIDSYLDLKSMAPELPFIPVLQGWLLRHYLDHIEQYDKAGVDLRKENVVALGTMCRRQDTVRAAWIIRALVEQGIRCHALGAKVVGLAGYHRLIASADSLAWSAGARHKQFRFSHECTHEDCRNCYLWAMAWRESDVLGSLPRDDAALSDLDQASLTKGRKVRFEHGGAMLSPFGVT